MGLNEGLGNREAEPRAAILAGGAGVDLEELLEELGKVLGGDPDARVPHLHPGPLQGRAHGDRDGPALGGELDGVHREVEEDLLDALRVQLEDQGLVG
ncbi:hypothetical protein D3C86_1947650 [compost metagenome]